MSGNQKILGIVSIVLGAFAIVFAWVTWVNIAALIAAIAGLVLAIMSRKGFAAAGEQSPVPTIGLVLSIIGLVFSIIGCVIAVISLIIVIVTGVFENSSSYHYYY